MIRVLVVDDHAFLRDCLVSLIEDTADFEVVGECADGAEVVEAVAALRPGIVVMDLRMAVVSGIEATAVLHREHPTVRVVVLTCEAGGSSRAAARAHGAAGYLVKGRSSHDLVLAALRRVALGGTAWPEDLEGLGAHRSEALGDGNARGVVC